MASAREPEVAVVIPTRDRETRLRFALDALAEQTLSADRFEVVVVRAADASSTRLATPPAGISVRFLIHEGAPGAAAQRNRGWRATTAPLVAFIDDDSRPAPIWLQAVLAAFDGESTFIQGRIEPDPSERHLLFGLARSHEIVGPSPRYESGNIAYPRRLLARLGGFDEAFAGAAWGEDTDLGLRARAVGARAVYVHDALVWHSVISRRLPDALRDAGRYDALVALLARYPEHRRELFKSPFLKESHAAVLLMLAGLTQARRRPARAAAAAVPYFGRALRSHLGVNPPTPRKLGRFALHLPAALAIDLAEVAVTLRAAVRHRVPVI